MQLTVFFYSGMIFRGDCMEHFTNKAELVANYIDFFDNNLSINSVGYNDFKRVLPYNKNRVQTFFSVHFILSGKGVFEIYGKRYRLGQYDMFLIPANETVCYYPDENDPWSYFWIDFVGDNAMLLMEKMGFSRKKPCFECNSPYSAYLLAKNFFGHLESTGNVGYFAALSLFYSLIDINTNSENVKVKSLRDRVISYIDTHYHEANLKISDICSFFNISHSYLCDLFKDGETVKEILTSKRLEEAKRLLFEGDLFVEEVSRSVGFMNAVHFMKVFKKNVGMTAGEYRKYARKCKADEEEI